LHSNRAARAAGAAARVSFGHAACQTRCTEHQALSAQHETEDHVSIDKKQVIAQLNRILECELAGVVRYTHYSMMIFGYSRIPIVSWFQQEASESLAHAQQAGEMVTRLGGHPSLAIGPLLETHEHDIGQILRETLQAEHVALGLYTALLKLVAGQNVALEEYARSLIQQEEDHIDEIDKMLRKPGDVEMSKEARDLS
jgi:bacterioferritin